MNSFNARHLFGLILTKLNLIRLLVITILSITNIGYFPLSVAANEPQTIHPQPQNSFDQAGGPTPPEALNLDKDVFIPSVDNGELSKLIINYAFGQMPEIDRNRFMVSNLFLDKDWARAFLVIKALEIEDSSPYGYFVVARKNQEKWEIAFEFDQDFKALMNKMPETLIDKPTKQFYSESANKPESVNGGVLYSLPWAVGEIGKFTGAPHDFHGIGNRPWSSLDFVPSSKIVRAAADGIAYVACANWIAIDHADGQRSTYYHVANIQIANGASVVRGQALGVISTQSGCGGSATGAHVHFAMGVYGQKLTFSEIAGKVFSSWTVQSNTQQYVGCLVRNGVSKCITSLSDIGVDIMNDGVQTLPDPNTIVVDDGDGGFSSSAGWHVTTSNWYGSACATDGDARWTKNATSGNDVDWAKWQPTFSQAGRYEVFVKIQGIKTGIADTSYARYTIHHSNGDTVVVVNQNNNYCSWISLGSYNFFGGSYGYVYLGDVTGEPYLSRSIIADSVKWVRLDNVKRIGIQAGHLDAPSWLGGYCANYGTREVELTPIIANNAATLLRSKGYIVDVLPTYFDKNYKGNLFVSLHFDADDGGTHTNICPYRTGYKVARFGGSPNTGLKGNNDASDQWAKLLWSDYGSLVGLPKDYNVTSGMYEYYALDPITYTFNATTPGAIIEMGWLSGDKALITSNDGQWRIARAIAETADKYLGGKDFAPSGYTLCASEGQRCSFTGTKDVAYGANTKFNYQFGVTNGIDCTNGAFGDAIIGVPKACYIKDAVPSFNQLKAVHSELCMDVPWSSKNNGTQIIQWSCQGSVNQAWRFVPMGNNYYKVVSKVSGKCLDVYGQSLSNGGSVVQWTCNSEDNQLFIKEQFGSYYRLRAKHSNLCIDVPGSLMDNGVGLVQWACHTGNNQMWSIQTLASLDDSTEVSQSRPIATDDLNLPKTQLTIQHVIVEGDSIELLTKVYGISKETIAKANPEISDWANIQNGSILNLPILVPASEITSQ